MADFTALFIFAAIYSKKRTKNNGMLRAIFLLTLCFFLSNIAVAAQADTLVVVHGYVYDRIDMTPLADVNVYETTTRHGASTDENGHFSLRLPSRDLQLRITHIGYTSRILTIKEVTNSSRLTILLERSEMQLDEVTVTSRRTDELTTPQMGTLRVSGEDIKRIPTVFGEADVIKALQTQPGVSAGTEGLAGMYVRGGNEDENLYMLDGIPLYKISHLGGLFSAFNVEAVRDVTFYKSSFPARYGGRLSSVLDVRTKDGDMYRYHGSATLGLTSGNLNFSGPIVKDRTSFAASVRRSWLEALSAPGLAIMNKQQESEGKKTYGQYSFTDVNLKVNHRFNSSSSAYVNFYYGNDYFKIGERKFMDNEMYFVDENITRMNWGNMLVSAGWQYRFSDKLSMSVTPSFTHYSSLLRKNIFESENAKDDVDYEERTTNKTTENGINDLNVGVHFDYRLSDRQHLNFGAVYSHHSFLPEMNRIQTSGIDGIVQDNSNNGEQIKANETAFYAEYDRTLSSVFRINAGLRLSMFGVDGVTYRTLEPRLSIRAALSERLSLKASYSRMNQFVQQISDSYISLPTDFWMPVNSKFKPLESDQLSAGMYYELPAGYLFTAEAFYKRMRNLLEYKEGYTFMPASVSWDDKLTSGSGRAYGAEWSVQKTNGKLTGMFSYGLMWSDRQFAEINLGKRFPSKYDNRHKINITANYKFNPKFELNGGWTYVTGNRLTLALEDYMDFTVNGFDQSLAPTNPFQEDWVRYYETRNNVRLPAYHRLDLGLNIYLTLKKGRTGIWNISVWNVYNRLNPIVIRTTSMYSDTYQKKIDPKFQTIGLFPIIPSISYTYKF